MSAAKQKADLEAIAEDEAKATTADEKEARQSNARRWSRLPSLRTRSPRSTLARWASTTPRILAYYWIELTSGLLLNVAMITAGIGLLRRKPWGITLGAATAAAKILRLVLIYGYFALALAPVLAEKSAAMIGKMIVQQQAIVGGSATGGNRYRTASAGLHLHVSAHRRRVHRAGLDLSGGLALVPARARARTADEKKAPPAPELTETW